VIVDPAYVLARSRIVGDAFPLACVSRIFSLEGF